MSVQLLGHINSVVPFSMVDGPGNRFVIFLQGCDFDCTACHNPQTISIGAAHGSYVSVAELLEQIRAEATYLSGITVSGGEATLQSDFVESLFRAIKADPELGHLTTFIDSNGAASPEVWEVLAPVLDGAMIDLKALDPETHMEFTGQPNTGVLESISLLAQMGLLYEVRLIIVSGFNDSPDVISRTTQWLQDAAPGVAIKLIGFRQHGTRRRARQLREPSSVNLSAIESQFREAGFSEILVV